MHYKLELYKDIIIPCLNFCKADKNTVVSDEWQLIGKYH